MTNPQTVRLATHATFLDDDGKDILENLATAETDTTLVAAPDGTGGVEFRAESGGGGGGGVMPWFDVTDPAYGAVHDGVTDDTPAIQAAIDACFAAGGGTVFFPPGIYQIDGALQDTSTYNSQLEIPTNTYTTTTPPMAIRLLGMAPVVPLSDIGSAPGAHAVPPTGGSILRSSWNGSISGHPAIIAAGQWGQRTNFMFLHFEEIMVMAHNDPKLTALQLQSVLEWSVQRVSITVDADEFDKDFCTHSNAVGLDAGQASEQPNGIYGLQIDSFFGGMVLGSEQAHGSDINIGKCKQGIIFQGNVGSPLFVRHANYFSKVLFYQCEVGLVFTGDIRWVNIGLLNIEHDPSPYATVYDIDDASNYARGFIQWHTTDYTTGPDELILNGGAGLSLFGANSKRWKLNNVVDIPTGTNPSTNPGTGRRLYTDSSTGALKGRTPAGAVIDYEAGSTLTIKDEGLSLATAATSIDFVGAGVTATGTGAGKTVTIPGGASALDDLSDVTISSPTVADRLRYNGSAWVNSALHWAPMMVLDPGTGNYLVLTDTSGNPIMAEV